MKKLLCILLIACFIACNSDRAKLIGHWHCIEDESGFLDCTLDINDSLYSSYGYSIVANLYSPDYRFGGWINEDYNPPTIYKQLINKKAIDFQEHCGVTYPYDFNGDTLLLEYDQYDSEGNRYVEYKKFIKVEHDNKNLASDFFYNLKIKSELDTFENTKPLINDALGIIYIGIPIEKKKYFAINDKFSVILGNKYSELGEIKHFIEAMLEIKDEDFLDNRSIILCCDKNVPEWALDSTRNMISKFDSTINKLYKTCVDKKTGNIGLIELK